MLADKYQKQAMRTAYTNERATTDEQRMLNAALGLLGESGEIAKIIHTDSAYVTDIIILCSLAGELADQCKKSIFHGHHFDVEDGVYRINLLHRTLDRLSDLIVRFHADDSIFVERPTHFEIASLKSELGDIAWYTALGAESVHTPLSAVFQGNIDKLHRRYPEGFSSEASKNRSE